MMRVAITGVLLTTGLLAAASARAHDCFHLANTALAEGRFADAGRRYEANADLAQCHTNRSLLLVSAGEAYHRHAKESAHAGESDRAEWYCRAARAYQNALRALTDDPLPAQRLVDVATQGIEATADRCQKAEVETPPPVTPLPETSPPKPLLPPIAVTATATTHPPTTHPSTTHPSTTHPPTTHTSTTHPPPPPPKKAPPPLPDPPAADDSSPVAWIITGVVGAAAIGIAAALLWAPEDEVNTRQQLRVQFTE